jgi:hypothetical protein
MYKKVLFALLAYSTTLLATEKAPWFGNVYEFDAKASFEHLKGKHNFHKSTGLAKASLDFTFSPEWTSELEFQAAKGGTSYAWSLRNLLLDDVAGDDIISVSYGVKLQYATHRFVKNPLLMQHGPFQTELHLAIGKEFEVAQDSYIHFWVAPYGALASHGRPWAGLEAHIETIFYDTHTLDLFAITEKGYGHKKLNSFSDFRDYSNIAYRFLDAGFRYSYTAYGYGSVFAGIKKRLRAHSCPRGVFTYELGVDIPFSL